MNDFYLFQNYPNPFNPSTTLSFVISHLPAGQAGSSLVTLKIYDVLGNEVAVLVNEEKPAGTYEVAWNAEGLASGVYFYQLKAMPIGREARDPETSLGQVFTATKKLLLLK